MLVFSISKAQNKITWGMGMNISVTANGNMHPRVTLDRAGNPLVVWGKMADQSVYFSRWTGTMFTTPVKLNGLLTVATASWMGPDIASHGDTIYVVVRQTPESADTSKHIFIISSFNGGISFSSPVRVDFIAESVSRFPTVTTDALGNPIVAFMKFYSSFMDSRWVVVKSTDFGKTFSIDVKASGWGSSAEVCDCCPGAIVSSGNKTAMLYRDNNINIRDIWTGISNNNAATFPNGFKADNNNWMINNCPSSGPDGVIVGDSLYSVFLSSGSGSYRNYLSKSSISKEKVNSVSKLTGDITGLGQQNYPRIANDGKAMAIVWKQTVSGVSQLPILFTNDIGKGFLAAYDTVDLADITNADVAMNNGNIFVVWQDDKSGTVKYRKGMYTPVNTGAVDDVKESAFTIFPNPALSIITLQCGTNLLNAEVSVYNVIGEKVFSQNLSNVNNSILDVRALKNGIYFLQLSTSNRLLTQKFIKQ